MTPEAASLDLPDLTANRPPADWYEYSYAYPEGVDELLKLADFSDRNAAEIVEWAARPATRAVLPAGTPPNR